jgi:hypothetical protein
LLTAQVVFAAGLLSELCRRRRRIERKRKRKRRESEMNGRHTDRQTDR